jgi:hypothetical protein
MAAFDEVIKATTTTIKPQRGRRSRLTSEEQDELDVFVAWLVNGPRRVGPGTAENYGYRLSTIRRKLADGVEYGDLKIEERTVCRAYVEFTQNGAS